MIQKKGVPENISHTVFGCIMKGDKIYVPLSEIVSFCNRFSEQPCKILGSGAAAIEKTKPKNLPEAVVIESKLVRSLLRFFVK
jgi:hypothetical protein